MDKHTELINILKAELTLLSKDILQNIHQKDIEALYKSTRKLYEKMAAIHLLDKQLDSNALQNLIAETPANISEESITKNKPETVKSDNDNPYKKAQNLTFVPKGQKQSGKKTDDSVTQKSRSQLKKINIGLNDRIAFIKHLFDNDQEAYTGFINRLNAFDSYEEGLKFINQEIKPKYNDWADKDEYEFRLLQLFELKFA
jgi:hypothetical protein